MSLPREGETFGFSPPSPSRRRRGRTVGDVTVINTFYLDPYDRDRKPHSAGAQDGFISEIGDTREWTQGQRMLAKWYVEHAVAGLVPPSTPMDQLSSLFGNVHKLLVDPDRNDFRYLIYGQSVAKKANMGGDRVWVSDLIEPTRRIFLTHYRDLVANPRLHVGILAYLGGDIPHREWVRAAAPLGTPDLGVTHFIVYTDTAQDAREA